MLSASASGTLQNTTLKVTGQKTSSVYMTPTGDGHPAVQYLHSTKNRVCIGRPRSRNLTPISDTSNLAQSIQTTPKIPTDLSASQWPGASQKPHAEQDARTPDSKPSNDLDFWFKSPMITHASTSVSLEVDGNSENSLGIIGLDQSVLVDHSTENTRSQMSPNHLTATPPSELHVLSTLPKRRTTSTTSGIVQTQLKPRTPPQQPQAPAEPSDRLTPVAKKKTTASQPSSKDVFDFGQTAKLRLDHTDPYQKTRPVTKRTSREITTSKSEVVTSSSAPMNVTMNVSTNTETAKGPLGAVSESLPASPKGDPRRSVVEPTEHDRVSFTSLKRHRSSRAQFSPLSRAATFHDQSPISPEPEALTRFGREHGTSPLRYYPNSDRALVELTTEIRRAEQEELTTLLELEQSLRVAKTKKRIADAQAKRDAELAEARKRLEMKAREEEIRARERERLQAERENALLEIERQKRALVEEEQNRMRVTLAELRRRIELENVAREQELLRAKERVRNEVLDEVDSVLRREKAKERMLWEQERKAAERDRERLQWLEARLRLQELEKEHQVQAASLTPVSVSLDDRDTLEIKRDVLEKLAAHFPSEDVSDVQQNGLQPVADVLKGQSDSSNTHSTIILKSHECLSKTINCGVSIAGATSSSSSSTTTTVDRSIPQIMSNDNQPHKQTDTPVSTHKTPTKTSQTTTSESSQLPFKILPANTARTGSVYSLVRSAKSVSRSLTTSALLSKLSTPASSAAAPHSTFSRGSPSSNSRVDIQQNQTQLQQPSQLEPQSQPQSQPQLQLQQQSDEHSEVSSQAQTSAESLPQTEKVAVTETQKIDPKEQAPVVSPGQTVKRVKMTETKYIEPSYAQMDAILQYVLKKGMENRQPSTLAPHDPSEKDNYRVLVPMLGPFEHGSSTLESPSSTITERSAATEIGESQCVDSVTHPQWLASLSDLHRELQPAPWGTSRVSNRSEIDADVINSN